LRETGVSAVPLGFPHDLVAAESKRQRLAGGRPDVLELPARPII
jgi:hypothetical protein